MDIEEAVQDKLDRIDGYFDRIKELLPEWLGYEIPESYVVTVEQHLEAVSTDEIFYFYLEINFSDEPSFPVTQNHIYIDDPIPYHVKEDKIWTENLIWSSYRKIGGVTEEFGDLLDAVIFATRNR
jgi:hypothetical protein